MAAKEREAALVSRKHKAFLVCARRRVPIQGKLRSSYLNNELGQYEACFILPSISPKTTNHFSL
jgi:hypothetical protein